MDNQNYKYTTYLEVSGRHLVVRRVPTKLSLKQKVNSITFINNKECLSFLNNLKLKLQNNHKVIDQDSSSFSVKHQSPLLIRLNVIKPIDDEIALGKAMGN